MTVPADEAVMTNGRPYARLVVATAVAVRVAKLSPSILTTRFKSPREDSSRHGRLPGHHLPQPAQKRVIARLFTSFLPHRQFGFSLLRSLPPAEPGRVGSRLETVTSAGVFFARPLVGSRWTG